MKKLVPIVAAGALVLVGCTKDSARKAETASAKQQLSQYLQSQPIPQFTWSQLRQNLIEIETAQSNTTATTSFMFLLSAYGTTGPLIKSCPSIGFPIPATYQLSNPQSKVPDKDLALPQIEANGVYTGDTTGTYVICIGDDGKPYAFYWEGFVATVTGPAHWDNTKGEIVNDGTSTAKFSTGK